MELMGEIGPSRGMIIVDAWRQMPILITFDLVK